MKKTSRTAAILGVAAVWLGGHFGPGFATGAFSTTWYVRYGWMGLITPLIAMLVTGGVMYFMTEYARSHGTCNYRPFALSCYGEKFGQVMSVLYDITFLLTVMCAGGLAISGEGNIVKSMFGGTDAAYWIGFAATILISALLCLYGSKLLSGASRYMMYAIVAVVLLIVVLSFTRGSYDLPQSFQNSMAETTFGGVLTAIFNGILYGCFQSTIVFNVMSVADTLESKKETGKAIRSGYFITVILMIGMVVTLFSYTSTFDIVNAPNNLPIMWVIQQLGMPWLSWIYALLMTLAVLSSAAGLAFAGCRRFDKLFSFIKNVHLRRIVITVILLGIAGFGASFGMGPLLRTGTSVVGYIGIPVLVLPALFWVSHKIKKDEKAA